MALLIRLFQDSFCAIIRAQRRCVNMLYEVLEQEAIGLPEDKMHQLIDFARFLKSEVRLTASTRNKSKRTFGSMKDDITYIAPDFDSCFSDNPAAFGMGEYM